LHFDSSVLFSFYSFSLDVWFSVRILQIYRNLQKLQKCPISPTGFGWATYQKIGKQIFCKNNIFSTVYGQPDSSLYSLAGFFEKER